VRAPVCYDAQVANLGSASTNILCEVLAGPGTTAVFANKLPQYFTVNPIPPSSTISLEMQVAPAGGNTVTQPELSCATTGE
jgi:hypothetical protein